MKIPQLLCLVLIFVTFPIRAAFIYLDEFQKKASQPQYTPDIEFEVCLPKQLPNVVLQDGFEKGELWCHKFIGWVRTKDDPGGWLDISGLQLGFSTRSWSVWDYATACVVALRESDISRLKSMSDQAAQANFEKMIEDQSPNSVPKILQQANALRALCHIRKDDVEWLFLEIYYVDLMPNMMALSLRKNSLNSHQFIDAKIQEQPSVSNTFIYFSYELARAANQAMQNTPGQSVLGPGGALPQLGATPSTPQPTADTPANNSQEPAPTTKP